MANQSEFSIVIQPRMMRAPQAARYLGMSPRQFEYAWRSHKIPYPFTMGRMQMWDRVILDQWADMITGARNPDNLLQEK